MLNNYAAWLAAVLTCNGAWMTSMIESIDDDLAALKRKYIDACENFEFCAGKNARGRIMEWPSEGFRQGVTGAGACLGVARGLEGQETQREEI